MSNSIVEHSEANAPVKGHWQQRGIYREYWTPASWGVVHPPSGVGGRWEAKVCAPRGSRRKSMIHIGAFATEAEARAAVEKRVDRRTT